MRVFIAGATGTLGIPLVKELILMGHEVVGLTQTEAKRPLIEQLGAKAVVADAFDGAAISRAVDDAKPDSVVNLLTAIPKQGPLRAADMIMTNRLRVTGTDYLLHASVDAGVRRMIAESVVFAYGFGDQGETRKREDAPLPTAKQPGGTKDTVNAARLLERQVIGAGAKGEIEGIVLRFGLLYGPDVPSTEHTLRMLKERRLAVVRTGEGNKPWIHIDDAVSAIVAALDRERSGDIYNIVDDRPATFREFLLSAAETVGAPRPRSVPLWFLRVTVPFAAAMLSTRLIVSNDKAKQDLGWHLQYPDIRGGIKSLSSGADRGKQAA